MECHSPVPRKKGKIWRVFLSFLIFPRVEQEPGADKSKKKGSKMRKLFTSRYKGASSSSSFILFLPISRPGVFFFPLEHIGHAHAHKRR
jgi:hypothetical protein